MRRVFAVLVAVLAAYLWRCSRALKNAFILRSNFPVGYYAHGDWTTHCKRVTDQKLHELKYCEDATLWDLLDHSKKLKERRVIITCDPGRKAWNTVMGPLANPYPHGGLWTYIPGKKSADLRRLTLTNYPKGHDFHPLGLDIYPSYGGNASNLFVVNHARERTVIEQFTLSPSQPTQATWVRTIVSNYFVSSNSIALTSPTSFYVSNDHLLTRRLPTFLGQVLPITETMLGLPLGWLSHISLEHPSSNSHDVPKIRHTFAALGISFANGVALSPDGKQVALATSSLGEIYFYSRSPNNTLKHTHTVPVPFSPDNIRFDGEGALLVTGHPNFPSLRAVTANKTGVVAPSWAVSLSTRLQPETPKLFDLLAPVSASERVSAVASHDIETVFQSNGTGFSSSSTTLHDSSTGTVYVVGLYEEGMLVCKP